MVRPVVVVSAGGVLGALARYGLTEMFSSPPRGFAWATFGINVSGCLLIGFVVVLAPRLRLFLATGVLGGYTTFSTYVVGMQKELAAGAPRTALAYGAATAIVALAAAWLGDRAATAIRRSRAEPATGTPASGGDRPGAGS
jgi:fluoride exporter